MKVVITFVLMVLLFAMIFAPKVSAHGSLEPKHGGIVQEAHDMVFELVKEEKSVSLYIRDHGEDYSATDLVASIVVLAGKEKSEASFIPSGGNRMVADIAVSEGAKVLVRVTDDDHHPITIRYTF
ncbi:hypothetical protein [Glaciecola sp. SC05]|uniref:hypothetical protein n=1 Tax=Glaciecola sp. SC05 TaxID=1987355 RepID=UPI00352936C5